MRGAALEAFLAHLFVDPTARARFAADPLGEGRRAGLSVEERRALLDIDRVGLELAARSFAMKRRRGEAASPHAPSVFHGKMQRLLAIVLHRA